MQVLLKRVYDPAEKSDGRRILVDRLWPRGLSRARAALNVWAKGIAPSSELRKWFSHNPRRWKEFRERYFQELSSKEDVVKEFKRRIPGTGPVTFLFGARDRQFNHAAALRDYLNRKGKMSSTKGERVETRSSSPFEFQLK